ncbi:hypothetical protein HMPREF9999_00494 [Alloprevotella sp. oral taxon 473 str. F0040]|nr:hypothetical protein HMPREF9999_00494 [Alloprevotella sp. oral taxon 473 str. F0040]
MKRGCLLNSRAGFIQISCKVYSILLQILLNSTGIITQFSQSTQIKVRKSQHIRFSKSEIKALHPILLFLYSFFFQMIPDIEGKGKHQNNGPDIVTQLNLASLM